MSEMAIPKRIPASPPSAEEMNRVEAKIRFTSMPSRVAALRFSATARSARPTWVKRITEPSTSISTMVVTRMPSLVPSMVSPARCSVGLGTVPLGKRTELAPSCQSQEKRLPEVACSTSATKIRASPMVEMSAEIGGACRRRSGRSATYSMTSPSSPQTRTARIAASQKGAPWRATSE